MKILSIVGARPQFIKAAQVSNKIRKNNTEILIHTGQHYDENMSDIFFNQLDIPKPDFNLEIGSAKHGVQTAKMLRKIEKYILEIKPDFVLVYGDTNSTLAGSLAASKQLYPVIHIEAGLRSYNKDMPEEINRIITDHIAELLFCPTRNAVNNLNKEGIKEGVEFVGDVMYDAVINNIKIANKQSNILKKLELRKEKYFLATVHRAENTNKKSNLKNIVDAFNQVNIKIVIPFHQKKKKYMKKFDLNFKENVIVVEPVSYLDMLKLEDNAKKILTDSGGIQKEAYFLKTPCITLRDNTEWVETIKNGWNIIVGNDKHKIIRALSKRTPINYDSKIFGNGKASDKIVNYIEDL